MKIILISPIQSDLGPCSISPLLKKEGHQVNILFVPELLQNCFKPLSHKISNRIKEFVNAADLIGINSLSENYSKTAILVDEVKKTIKAPLVWGGIHATLRPQDCIEHADIVCVGEGEEAMLELVRKLEAQENPAKMKNLLFRSDGNNIKKVELRAAVDLDSLLPLDYDLNSQYIVENSKIRNLEEPDFWGVFYSYSSRGCPFRCSYCCSAFMHRMYEGQKFFRQRSLENVIREIKEIKQRFISCKEIWFNEADFLSGKTQKEIDDFAQRYKAEISIPFSIWSHPAAIKDDNIRALKGAGFSRVNIGTINGSDRIQRQIYRRNAAAALYLSAAEVLKKYGITVEYDVILCNPYENDDELIDTIELLMRLPKPFKILIYSLTYFPKTELYNMVLRDGVVKENQDTRSYTKAAYQVWKFQSQSTYLNIVLSLMRGWARRSALLRFYYYGILPEPLFKILIKKPIIKFFKYLPFRPFLFCGIANLIIMADAVVKKISRLIRRF